MTKIKYTIDGKDLYIEVTEEFAKKYKSILKKEQRQEWRDKKHPSVSLECLLDMGNQFEDITLDVEAEFVKKDEIERLYMAINKLNPKQKWLIEQVFFLGRAQSDIARELGVDKTSIRDNLQTIYAILRNLL